MNKLLLLGWIDSDVKSEETQDSTWSKVVVHEPQNSSQKVTVTTMTSADGIDDGNDSDPESTTETAIIHHSHNNTAIYDEYPSNQLHMRSVTPKKYNDSNELQEPTHKKSQSSVYVALDSFVATGTLQESLKSELIKLFEVMFLIIVF